MSIQLNKGIAFVILHYLTIDDTLRCVASIKKNVPGAKIIIVDNGSENHTGAKLEKKLAKDKSITVLRNRQNLGFAKGNNVGFKYAKKEYNPDFIVLCNNDTQILKDNFALVLNKQYKKSGFAVFGPRERLANGKYYQITTKIADKETVKAQIKKLNMQIKKPLLYKTMIFFRKPFSLLKKNLKAIVGILPTSEKLMDVNSEQKNVVLHGAFLVFSRKYIDLFDGLDDRTFLYEEEQLLALRLKKHGLTSVYDPKITILHRHHSATNSVSKDKRAKSMARAKYELDSKRLVLAELRAIEEDETGNELDGSIGNQPRKSIKKNATLNVIRVASGILFPLITFPYATRILGTDNIGKIQFGSSIVLYFSLLAALGVTSYGTREGAYCRDNRKKLSKFASEVFTINLITTAISYLLLIILLSLPTELVNYRELIFIQSITILCGAFGVEWIYGAEEDYRYITIRSIIMHILSLILLFIFVKEPDDYYIYALISVISSVGANIFNFFHAKKYVDLRLTRRINLKKHLRPLIILFVNTLAIQVYINSDVIMLGFLSGDRSVGLYSVAAKVYSLVKSLINAVIAVTIPRLSYYASRKDTKGYKKLIKVILRFCIFLIIPATLGIIVFAPLIIQFAGGESYAEGVTALQILAFALLFAVLSNFFGNAILVSLRQEKKFLFATICGASVNIILNLWLIPMFSQNGAAITTVIAEIIVAGLCGFFVYRTLKNKE